MNQRTDTPVIDAPARNRWRMSCRCGVLLGVFAVLLALTFVTVAATWFDFGGWALVIALGIATIKASLVALYFMHLRYDNPFYAVVLVLALMFLALLLSLTLLDTLQYQPDVENWQQIGP